jgi:hypothetical protein
MAVLLLSAGSKLDRKVAKDTFSFYNHILSAERDRDLIFEIQRQGDLRELTSSELRRQQILTQHVAQRTEHFSKPSASPETGAWHNSDLKYLLRAQSR